MAASGQNGARRLIASFNHGSMANALPHAIGAQASHPGRQVVALSGDGGLAMLMGELLTVRQQQLPVKVVVFSNGALSPGCTAPGWRKQASSPKSPAPTSGIIE